MSEKKLRITEEDNQQDQKNSQKDKIKKLNSGGSHANGGKPKAKEENPRNKK
jgi:hypothetical protein